MMIMPLSTSFESFEAPASGGHDLEDVLRPRINRARKATITALALACLSACGEDAHEVPQTVDHGTALPPVDAAPSVACSDAVYSRYRVDSITIPTVAQAESGEVVGFDLDGTFDGCSRLDWAGGVDNSLIEAVGPLRTFVPELDLQDQVDGALCGTAEAPPVLSLVAEVGLGTDCAVVSLFDGGETLLFGPFPAIRDGDTVDGSVDAIPLDIPVDGLPFNLTFTLERFRFRGTVGPAGLSDVVIGASVAAPVLEGLIIDLMEELYSGVDYDNFRFVFLSFADLANEQGQCAAQGSVSLGLFATAGTDLTIPTCRP